MQVVNIMNLDYLPDVGARLAEQVTLYLGSFFACFAGFQSLFYCLTIIYSG